MNILEYVDQNKRSGSSNFLEYITLLYVA